MLVLALLFQSYKSELFKRESVGNISNKIIRDTNIAVEFTNIEFLKSSEEMIENYKKMKHPVKPPNEINEENYFSNHLSIFACEEHIQMLNLDYRCVKEETPLFPRDMNLFVVQGNLQKYFMILSDNMKKYEFGLYKTLNVNGTVLKLLQHKTLKGRFVGIFQYLPNLGSLDYLVKTSSLSLYKTLKYMRSITKNILTTYFQRDTKEYYFRMNIIPTNLMIVDDSNFSIKLIRIFTSSTKELTLNRVPEDDMVPHLIDTKKEAVYRLAKLFFFMVFKKYHLNFSNQDIEEMDKFLLVLDQEPEEYPDLDIDLIRLIRKMLNTYAVDRITLEETYASLDHILSKSEYRYDMFFDQMENYYYFCKTEIDHEIYKRNYQLKNEAQNVINKMSMVDAQKIKNLTVLGYVDLFNNMYASNMSNYTSRMNKFGMINEVNSRSQNLQVKDRTHTLEERKNNIAQMRKEMEDAQKERDFIIDFKLTKKTSQRTDYVEIVQALEEEFLLIVCEFVHCYRRAVVYSHEDHHEELVMTFEMYLVFFICFLVTSAAIGSVILKEKGVDRYHKKDFPIHLIF